VGAERWFTVVSGEVGPLAWLRSGEELDTESGRGYVTQGTEADLNGTARHRSARNSASNEQVARPIGNRGPACSAEREKLGTGELEATPEREGANWQ
jgi:hypothetical protein